MLRLEREPYFTSQIDQLGKHTKRVLRKIPTAPDREGKYETALFEEFQRLREDLRKVYGKSRAAALIELLDPNSARFEPILPQIERINLGLLTIDDVIDTPQLAARLAEKFLSDLPQSQPEINEAYFRRLLFTLELAALYTPRHYFEASLQEIWKAVFTSSRPPRLSSETILHLITTVFQHRPNWGDVAIEASEPYLTHSPYTTAYLELLKKYEEQVRQSNTLLYPRAWDIHLVAKLKTTGLPAQPTVIKKTRNSLAYRSEALHAMVRYPDSPKQFFLENNRSVFLSRSTAYVSADIQPFGYLSHEPTNPARLDLAPALAKMILTDAVELLQELQDLHSKPKYAIGVTHPDLAEQLHAFGFLTAKQTFEKDGMRFTQSQVPLGKSVVFAEIADLEASLLHSPLGKRLAQKIPIRTITR